MSPTKTVRLTTAQALVRWLTAQRTVLADGSDAPLFPGVFAIFGHGNVTCLGEALASVREVLPTYRGQNEQGMALAAIAYGKAARRRQIMVATSSIGPGATNMVTAAAVAHADRLPLLLLAGDTFVNRVPDPVLQQVEHFDAPSTTVNDSFRAVVRYWDRVTRPAQLVSSLPQAVATMLDPADCGPALLALPQDVQGEAFDWPARFFEPALHEVPRPRPDTKAVSAAAAVLAAARRPLLIAGGGVHYSLACDDLARFAERHRLPVVETVAGKACLVASHPCYAGPIGVTGGTSANALAAETDAVLAVGTRLQDFTTGSWTVFRDDSMRLVMLNAARFDATKHGALAVVGDARESLAELSAALGDWQAPEDWMERARAEYATWDRYVDEVTAPARGVPSYARVIGAVNRLAADDDLVLSAAGGLPGELNKCWRAKAPGTFDVEYGYSCMGYEISGGWGARMARREGEVVVFVGDGSYLMMNSDIYSSVLTGQKLIVVLCDNGGFAVIDRLQTGKGSPAFNNMFDDCAPGPAPRVDFARNAEALGARAEEVTTVAELEEAFARARAADRTSVIVVHTDPNTWTGGDAWWDLGVPEVSEHATVAAARAEAEEARKHQRLGW